MSEKKLGLTPESAKRTAECVAKAEVFRKLKSEAIAVHNETGKSPRELLEQRDALLKACKHGLAEITGQVDDGLLTYSMPSTKRYWLQVAFVLEDAIKATN